MLSLVTLNVRGLEVVSIPRVYTIIVLAPHHMMTRINLNVGLRPSGLNGVP